MNHQELVESLLLCFPNDTPSSLIRRYSKFWGGQRNHQPNDDFPTNFSFRSLYLDYIRYESNHWLPRNGISQGTVACPTICWSGCRRDVGCSKRNQLSVLLSGRGSTMMASLARGETLQPRYHHDGKTVPGRGQETERKWLQVHQRARHADLQGLGMSYDIYDVISGFAPSNQTWLAPLIKTPYRLEFSAATFDYQRVVFFFSGKYLIACLMTGGFHENDSWVWHTLW